MGYRLIWTNNSSGHSGSYVYRSTSTIDPAMLPSPDGTADPVAQGAQAEFTSGEELPAGTHYFRVQDFDGAGVGTVSAEQTLEITSALASAAIGDEVEGGIYAGIDSIDGTDYYIVAAKASGEEYGLQWKTSQTSTPGTSSNTDGLANTQAMQAAGIADHPAAEHCVNYAGGGFSDWHMPARSQMTLMYNNLAGHAEFSATASSNDYVWTSREYSSSAAYARRFSDGYETYFASQAAKDFTNLRTRPVRRVAV